MAEAMTREQIKQLTDKELCDRIKTWRLPPAVEPLLPTRDIDFADTSELERLRSVRKEREKERGEPICTD